MLARLPVHSMMMCLFSDTAVPKRMPSLDKASTKQPWSITSPGPYSILPTSFRVTPEPMNAKRRRRRRITPRQAITSLVTISPSR
ncbi:hypothetical protein D3C79_801810 [compost metagenome]